MTEVKDDLPDHMLALLGQVMDGFRADLHVATSGSRKAAGLRSSQIRMLSLTPAEGMRVTDLAERVGMTKQGCGQFVTQLVGTGHLTSAPSPDDARLRIVRRTATGERNVVDVTARMARIEDEWRAAVGARRYATFRRVVEDLVLG